LVCWPSVGFLGTLCAAFSGSCFNPNPGYPHHDEFSYYVNQQLSWYFADQLHVFLEWNAQQSVEQPEFVERAERQFQQP
jgi:hypothetical protein